MHNRNAVRYFIILSAILFFLFVSNDFGLMDVQKTAIVTAVGIDREGEDFVLSSQIALPVSGEQKGGSKTVQIVSKGKTVADAFEKINDKTGWYPKLVFCKLIVLGETAVQQNVFNALDFFLRDEYVSDDCNLAVYDGNAKDLLNHSTPIDDSSGTAIDKILSAHAERVGAVLPNTLREFSASSFGDSKSGFLPILKLEETQERTALDNAQQKNHPPDVAQTPQQKQEQDSGKNSPDQDGQEGQGAQKQGSGSGGQSGQEGQGGQNQQGGQGASKSGEESEMAFSARETAMFLNGVAVNRLTAEETFAFAAVKSKLQLAAYTVPAEEQSYTLTIKHNSPDVKLKIDDNGVVKLKISVKLVAGVADFSKAENKNRIEDAGDVPPAVFRSAEEQLKKQIESVFEKSCASGCDLFGLIEYLKKYENRYFQPFKEDIFSRVVPTVSTAFSSIR